MGWPRRVTWAGGPVKADAGSGNACPEQAGRGGAACAGLAPLEFTHRAASQSLPGILQPPGLAQESGSAVSTHVRTPTPGLLLAGGCGASRRSGWKRSPRRTDVQLACRLGSSSPSAKCAPSRGPQGGSWGHPVPWLVVQVWHSRTEGRSNRSLDVHRGRVSKKGLGWPQSLL